MIAVHLEHGGFVVGRELDEASALWEAARTHAPRRIIPFDRRRFESLRSMATMAASPAVPSASALSAHRGEWHDVPDAGHFFGRTDELQMLSRWLLEDRCRLVGVLGAGGIGKTLLTARLARALAPQFAVVYWRSLRNALPVEDWLAGPSERSPDTRLFPLTIKWRASTCCCSYSRRSAASLSSTTWKPSWSRAPTRAITGRVMPATGRSCGVWAKRHMRVA